MNLPELVYFSLILWIAAWLTNVIARSFEIPLFVASGITVTGFVILASVFDQTLKFRDKQKDSNHHQE